MSLALPPHLQVIAAAQPAIQHTWDAGDAMDALGNETPALLKNVGALSLRSVLGLQAALAEWVAQRFHHLRDDPELTQVIEAVWAASIDYRYLRPEAMTFPDAAGPIEGPRREIKMISKKICKLYRDGEFGSVRRVIGAANLVKFLLPDSKAFQAWFKQVVQRLPSLSAPAARESGHLDISLIRTPPEGVSAEIFGTPVPREAFDPQFDLSSADSATLINTLLVEIGSRPNPFLFTAKELSASGFPGSPYRYAA